MFIDVHAHLYSEKYEELEKIIENAKEYNVQKIICCGSDLDNSKYALELARRYENVFACIGVHPDDVGNFDNESENILREMAEDKKVVGIGEIGLDYYTSEVSKEQQKEACIRQMKLAYELHLPIVIHCREATGDMIDLMKQNLQYCKYGVLMHCFNKNSTVAKIFLDMGFYLSIGGCSTFPHTEKLHEAIKDAPLDRLMLETDCPYMTPVPFRGQINEPKNVVIVAENIANIKGISVEQVANQTTKNAIDFFRLK